MKEHKKKLDFAIYINIYFNQKGGIMPTQKAIYISDEQKKIWDEAAKLFKGEKSFSQIVTDALIKEIQHKKDMADFTVFDMIDEGLPIKLLGKKLVTYIGIVTDGEVTLRFINNHKKATKLNGVDIEWFENLENEQGDHFEFNGYQTKSGDFYIEIKLMNIEGKCVYSILEYVDLRIYFKGFMYRDELFYGFPDEYRYILSYPDTFINKFKKSIDDKFIARYIE